MGAPLVTRTCVSPAMRRRQMFLVGFSACAIGVSAWPFVVPIMLTFFEEMKDKPRIKLFDAL